MEVFRQRYTLIQINFVSYPILQRFYELMRDAKMEHYRAGRPFATEGQTECDGGLRVLLSGKMAAKCDDTFLVTILD